MASRLKSLELIGYKTFASKSQFLFGEHVTCIVGPNGSGKSNIADSIRWVLGEQSFSLLRGKKTEDMIFAGSEQRPRASMAQATVTFDNSDGWLPIDFAEVSITRRAYRDGTNEYLLNGQRARLRDINELLAKVGLSERTYTIVGQGSVDTALSLKAEERRALFEEAAGIGIYRGKREDALRKLDQTQHNLERVHDILGEIKPRLKTLERQATRARDFQQVKTELDGVLKIWYGYHWHEAQQNLGTSHQQADEQFATLENIRDEQQTLSRSLADLRAKMTHVRGQLNQWQSESLQLRTRAETLNRNLAVADERLRAFAEQRETLSADLQSLEGDHATQSSNLNAAREEVQNLEAEREATRAELLELESARTQHEAERKRAADEANSAQQQAARIAAKIAERNAQHSQLSAERDRTLAAQNTQIEQLAQADAVTLEKQSAFAERETAAQTATAQLAQAEADLAKLGERIARTEIELTSINNQLNEAVAAEGKLTARAEALSQLRAAVSADSGLAVLRRAAADGKLSIRELADTLAAPPELDTAITASLGQFIHTAIVEEADTALDLLTQTAETGRASLLPLATARPAPLADLPSDPDIVGIASQLITCQPEHRPAVDALLGSTLIVRTAQVARLVAPTLPTGFVAATLNGELFFANGAIIAGQDVGEAESASSTLALAREQRELPATIEHARIERQNLEVERDGYDAVLRQLRLERDASTDTRRSLQAAERETAAALSAARLELDRAEAQARLHRDQIANHQSRLAQLETEEQSLNQSLQSLSVELDTAQSAARAIASHVLTLTTDELNEKIAERQTQAAVAARAAADAASRLTEHQTALDRAAGNIQSRKARIDSIALETENFLASISHDRTELADLQSQIDTLRQSIEPAEAQFKQLEFDLVAVESAETEIRSGLHSSERINADLQLNYARKKDEIESLRRQITDDFGLVAFDYSEELPGPTPLPLDGVVEHLPHVETLPEGMEELLNRRRGQLRRMGAINPDALREFEEVKERHDFLVTQIADLESAGGQLREVIAELDALMEREFRRTFDAVAEEFRDTFSRLFGGGTAKLVLTDPDNLTNTGIDILAKLPGRKQQGLALLSGGERALTASALLFALLKVNPPPFAMMDEVDAALDEANVGRFRDLLIDLSKTTQFVVITHNRNTVQAADTVYGISMGPDSVSQAISLKLDGEKVAQF